MMLSKHHRRSGNFPQIPLPTQGANRFKTRQFLGIIPLGRTQSRLTVEFRQHCPYFEGNNI
jgi:hypothetical protein